MHKRGLVVVLLVLVGILCGTRAKVTSTFANDSTEAEHIALQEAKQTHASASLSFTTSKTTAVATTTVTEIKATETRTIVTDANTVTTTTSETTVDEHICEIPEETATNPDNTYENIQEVAIEDNNYDEIEDCVVINGKNIPIVYAPAEQCNVDAYDVVQDNELFLFDDKIFLFGHSDRSFSILDTVNTGETITLKNNGYETNYRVQRSELGILVDDNEDIMLLSDGSYTVYKDYGSQAIILITCAGYAWNYRWVVIATTE